VVDVIVTPGTSTTTVIVEPVVLEADVIVQLPGAGPEGDEGLSAYEVAVANGFVGNEATWLASLVGPPGDGGSGTASNTFIQVTDPVLELTPGFGPYIWFVLDGTGTVIDIRKGVA